MSFKVKDLSISLSVCGDTCTSMTKPTGCIGASAFGEDGPRQRNLVDLKAELRRAMMRS